MNRNTEAFFFFLSHFKTLQVYIIQEFVDSRA